MLSLFSALSRGLGSLQISIIISIIIIMIIIKGGKNDEHVPEIQNGEKGMHSVQDKEIEGGM